MDVVAFLTTVLIVIVAFGVVLFICELCQWICDYVNNIDMIYKWDWYLLPSEIQRMILRILLMTQQPVEYVCFGRISCSRETFKKVVSP